MDLNSLQNHCDASLRGLLLVMETQYVKCFMTQRKAEGGLTAVSHDGIQIQGLHNGSSKERTSESDISSLLYSTLTALLAVVFM